MAQSKPKKLVLLTRHYFSTHNRKTTVHFLAREFAKRGYDVHFVSVGRSILSCMKKGKAGAVPDDLSRQRFSEVEKGIFSIVMNEYVHPFSSKNKVLNFFTTPKLLQYGKSIPKGLRNSISDSDIVLIECGYGIAYFDALKKLCKEAKFVYFATDPLAQVGLRREFEDIEKSAVQKFDVVRVASNELGARFASNANTVVIPQGLDKSAFDSAIVSPYPANTFNLVSIGDMSFDADSIITMAESKSDATFHIFGVNAKQRFPKNVVIHGEVEFTKLVPYIKFADVGVMPYRMNAHMSYLNKTSLKFLQYSYCGLPIITACGAEWNRGKIFEYDSSNADSIIAAVTEASETPKDLSLGAGIVDWGNCTDQLISHLQ